MGMTQILVFPRGQLDATDKERMAEAGIIAVEADDPSQVVTVLPCSTLLRADDLLMAAMKGSTKSYASVAEFTKELNRRLKAREKSA